VLPGRWRNNENDLLGVQKPLSLSDMCAVLDQELASVYTFIGKIPEIDEVAESDLRRLVSTNFFPVFAVKQMSKWADMRLVDRGMGMVWA
jgi:hypothetical protein